MDYTALFYDAHFFPKKVCVIGFSSIHEEVDVLKNLAIETLEKSGRDNVYTELGTITRCDGKLLYGVSFNKKFQNQENPKRLKFLRKLLRYIKPL